MRAQTTLRVAVATTVSVLTAVAAMGPVHAATQVSNDRDHSAGSRSADAKPDRAKGPDHSDGNASTRGDVDGPQPESTADKKGRGANSYDCEDEGAEGPYCGTDRTEDSANGKGDGQATGRPGAGTVGRADNKNPKGQEPGPEDRNRGYECDQPGDEPNQGIAEGNPAHTGCSAGTDAPDETNDEEAPEEEGPGTTRVTVCHLTGNGSYVELTIDDDALQAHLDHGDLEEVPAEGCAAPAEENPDGSNPDGSNPDEGNPGGDDAGDVDDEVLGTEDEVLGTEQEAAGDTAGSVTGEGGANRAPATVAPAESAAPTSGFLPATGAGDYAALLAGGALLLVAGGAVLLRRRLGSR